MRRRTYLRTVGTTVTLPALPTFSAKDDEQEEERKPVYYTVDVPSQDMQLVHISAPTDLLDTADWIYLNDKSVNIHHRKEARDVTWEIVNVLVYGEDVDWVRVGNIEADKWDSLEMDKIALMVSRAADLSFLEIIGDGSSMSIRTDDKWIIHTELDFHRYRLETKDVSEVSVETIESGEKKSVPVFQLDSDFII